MVLKLLFVDVVSRQCCMILLTIFGYFRWERLGDIVVLPVTSFKDPIWDSIGDELWPAIAESLNARRLARQVSNNYELHLTSCFCLLTLVVASSFSKIIFLII